MAQEIKRPDEIEIVITFVCVCACVRKCGVGWGGGYLLLCVPSEEDFLYSVLCL